MFMPAISAIGAAVPVAASMVRSFGSAPQAVDTSPIASMLSRAEANASANNAWSAQQAAQQMAFQRQMQENAMRFNAAEAAKNRDWQQYMSNTSHQREVADLKAAGLNPILSAMGGNGAAVGSGATAAAAQGAAGAMGQTDTTANNAIATLLSSWISSLTALENQRVSAQSNEAVADKYNAMTAFVEQMRDVRERQMHAENLTYQYYSTGVQDALQRYISDNNLRSAQTTAAAMRFSAIQAANASKYHSDTMLSVAQMENQTKKDMQKAGFRYDVIESFIDYQFGKGLQKSQGEIDKELAHIRGAWNVGAGIAHGATSSIGGLLSGFLSGPKMKIGF